MLEQDGTEVDENEILNEFRRELFLLLRPNEEWRQDGVTIVINGNYLANI